MARMQYAECPNCGNFAIFDPKSSNPDGIISVWCKHCRQSFPFQFGSIPYVPEGYRLVNGPFADADDVPHTAPVDAPNVIQEYVESMGGSVEVALEQLEQDAKKFAVEDPEEEKKDEEKSETIEK